MIDVPFTIADATVLTEAGYVGEDVESILSNLLQSADYDVERAKEALYTLMRLTKLLAKVIIHQLHEMLVEKVYNKHY